MSAVAGKAIASGATLRVTQKGWLTGFSLVVSDCAAVVVGIVLSLAVFRLWYEQPGLLASELLPAATTLLVFAALGLYPVVGLNPVQEFRRALLGSIVGYGIAASASFLRTNPGPAVFAAFTFAWAVTVLLVLLFRAILRSVCCGRSWWGTPAIMFGAGDSGRQVLQTLKTYPSLGLKVVAVFDNDYPDASDFEDEQVHLGPTASASGFAQSWGIDHAIVAMPNARGKEMKKIISTYGRTFKSLLVIPEIAGISSVWVEPRDFGGVLGLQVHQNLMNRNARLLKRMVDFVLAASVGILLLPLLAVIYAAIRLSSPGPVFYGQSRIGRDNSTFTAWKFRSMYVDADEVLKRLLEQDANLLSQWKDDYKLKNDPRITLVGRFLRKTSLDELPQLWNVLRGDMSMVGPRPIVAAEIVRYADVFEAYKSVRPGITGMWQVSGRNNTTYLERTRLDEYYVRNWSVWLDIYILGRTIKTVLLGEGAY